MVTIDGAKYEAYVGKNKRPLKLTSKEFLLLHTLAVEKGRVVSRDHLLLKVWGIEQADILETRTVDQHVARIRRHLGRPFKKCIATVLNAGYKGVDLHLAGTEKEPEGTVESIERQFGPRPYALIKVRIHGVVPHLVLGARVRLA